MYIFESFLSLPRLADNKVKIVDERGQNIMCELKLLSVLVVLSSSTGETIADKMVYL